MGNTVLESIAAGFSGITEKIADMEELIDAARDANEDVTAYSAELALLKNKAQSWETMLKARGYLS